MTPTTDPTALASGGFDQVQSFVTGTAGPALFGIAIVALIIGVGIKYLKKFRANS